MRATPPALLLLFAVGCAAKEPPPQSPAGAPPPPPPGSKRLPSSLACESRPPGDEGRPTGSLERDVIKNVVHAHKAEMKACYDALLPMHAATEGRVMARFAIAPSGAVEASCVVRSSVNDATLDRCVIDRLLTWTFPRPDGGGWVLVDQPFVFSR